MVKSMIRVKQLPEYFLAEVILYLLIFSIEVQQQHCIIKHHLRLDMGGNQRYDISKSLVAFYMFLSSLKGDANLMIIVSNYYFYKTEGYHFYGPLTIKLVVSHNVIL